MTSPFEAIVRPILRVAYDEAFPHRASTDVNVLNAEHTSQEVAMITMLAGVYAAASTIDSSSSSYEKVRHGVMMALKSLRKTAELRKRKFDISLRRDQRPVYRYRAVSPDGQDVTYPKRGTVKADKRYALIWRRVPKPPEQIREAVEDYYRSYMNDAKTDQRRHDLRLGIERDIETELAKNAQLPSPWIVRNFANKPSALTHERNLWNRNAAQDRYHREAEIVEGTPYQIDGASATDTTDNQGAL
jgi:hypothetical protein